MTNTIDLCVDWVKVGESAGGTFDAVIRNLAMGEWSLTADTASVTLQGAYTLADVNTIRVVEGRTINFAGYVAPVASGVGGLDIWADTAGEHFTLSGPDLWSIPASRVAYPTPSTDPAWATSFDERTGYASSVAAGYIRDNLGASAIATRQWPGVTVIDRGQGIIGAWSARLQPLDDLVQRICREGGITCRLSIDYAGAPKFDLIAPRDRSATTVLSDQGDLVNVHRRRTRAKANYIISGGQGLLNARTFVTAGTATGAARKELFSDQAVLSTPTELQQSANANLAANGADWSIHAELATTAAQTLVLGTDYDLGDTIAVEIRNVRYPVVVSAVRLQVTPERQIMTPILGDAAPDLLGGLIRDVANLQSRFDTTIA